VLRLTLLASAAALLATSHGLAADAADAAGPNPPAASASELASGHDVAEAERLAGAAFAAYEQQQYARAIELYEQAWSAAPSADISFNIARVYDRGLKDPGRARDYYRRYVADPNAVPHRRRIAELRLAELQVTPAETEPTTPVLAEPPATTLTGSATAPLQVAPTSLWTPRKLTALVLGGAGVSALGLGLGFALSAQGERNEWQQDCDGNACTSQRAVDAARSAGRKADIATVALASGAGLLGIGAALWWLGPSTADGTPRARLQVVPTANATDLTCTISGRF
jgi:tetratricopeptide (TPR) repeat protein